MPFGHRQSYREPCPASSAPNRPENGPGAYDRETYTNGHADLQRQDRKSTRLNSSHGYISYAVFCLKKKKKNTKTEQTQTETRGIIKKTTVTTASQTQIIDTP